ncbi:hypothetical protein CEQ50_01975 [Vibrio anguillarum]|nr:hypothetical protein CEQ50_01975 [Vibrio anguillarum]
MFEKLFRLFGYEKTRPVTEESENVSKEPTLENHIVKISRYHNDNFSKIEDAISHTQRDLELLIGSSASKDSEDTLNRLNTLMLGIWCESRLHKLVYEKNLFSEDERKFIYSGSNLEEKWKKSLEIALRRHKGLENHVALDINSLGFALFQIYSEIKNWIDIHFSPVIRLRNKVAHSQWVFPFMNYQDGWDSSWSFKLCTDSKALLSRENVLTLKYKHELLKRVAIAINNLALANTEYEVQDFDEMYNGITEQANKLGSMKGSDIKNYRDVLIHGHRHKQENKKKASEKAVKNAIDKLKQEYDFVPKQ